MYILGCVCVCVLCVVCMNELKYQIFILKKVLQNYISQFVKSPAFN